MATDSPTNRRARLGEVVDLAVGAGLLGVGLVVVEVAIVEMVVCGAAVAGELSAWTGAGVGSGAGAGSGEKDDTAVGLTVESAGALPGEEDCAALLHPAPSNQGATPISRTILRRERAVVIGQPWHSRANCMRTGN